METEADLARRTGDPALYAYYFRSVGLTNLVFLTITPTLYAFFITFPQYWLQLWTEAGGSTWFYTTGYIFISIMSWASTCAQIWCLLIRLAPQSGWRLHERLLHIVTSAPLSYFSQTENGSILNRFSQDIQLIDNQLPSALQTVVVQILKLVMQVILLCVAQKWLAVSLPACIFVLYVIQRVYLRTSRQLRFLELQTRAGVFSSFLDSIEGLETIRAFGWSEAVRRDNIRCVDDAQRPEFLLLCLQRWLNIVLDLLAAAIAASVLAIAVALRGHVSGGQIGVALNIMLVVNTTLLKLVKVKHFRTWIRPKIGLPGDKSISKTSAHPINPDLSMSDDLITNAISKAGLASHFVPGNTQLSGEAANFAEHPILDQKLSLFKELSVGQCQLFGLCRALVKVLSLRGSGVNPVILLDEITSSLDTLTESIVHRVIDEFTHNGHTVIIVAHRLGALEVKPGRDTVVLMADGRVQEVIRDLGPDTFQNLAKIA
ncbi:hypothetical protein E0Z10_g7042 [Xylaria hypoxylon]|uniref:ABC transmembrane type-1 domain-containing protein n=1 Tax=Xylaria hypoxylon TaxID=37992 RepID=A0A4Z0YW87_9PEZI|nr:hypothetical protein E0Z10_g7042 [Xylaria hypoxylon]